MSPSTRGVRSARRLLVALALVLGGCRERSEGGQEQVKGGLAEAAGDNVAVGRAPAGLPLGPPPDKPNPLPGMIFVAPGALVVGTPRGVRPRRADRELPGEQIMLEGFHIDRYPFPNEEGAIPATSVSRDEAAALCSEKGKRLCTELEWERACKGPDNRSYEYGQSYDSAPCKTGGVAYLRPSGFHVGCQSDFGVRDLHGGPFEWTASDFNRGQASGLAAVRGGNDPAGEVAGRCANVEPRSPLERSGTIGFRCCAGPVNQPQVELGLEGKPGLTLRAGFPEAQEKTLIAAMPDEARAVLLSAGRIESHRAWLWRPIANEELHLLALCGRGMPAPHGPRCGLLLVRVAPGNVQVLAWVSSSRWVADLHRPGPHEYLWLIGGDQLGSFKRLIRYKHGDIEVGEPSRGAPKKHPKRR